MKHTVRTIALVVTVVATGFAASGCKSGGGGHSRARIRAGAKRERIFLGDWYTTAIAPVGVSYEAIGYDRSTCPTAERLASATVNLPTDIHITEKDAERIISTIRRLGTI